MAQSALGTWRAIKVVRAATSHEGRIYERELEAVQRFEPLSREHEGFADILQTGRGGEGRWFYYVMELADDAASGQPWQGNRDGIGYSPQTLSRVLGRRGRLSAPECVDLGLRLARSLLRLHRAGLIHRDIKPSNIIFVKGEAKLADIGLVVEQSKARSYVGTHGYIPPDGPNTVQADIYALGMVLYEAAMGLPHEQFPRPSPALRSSPDAPTLREINAIVLRACAPNPLHRYADASELESDLALVSSAGSVRRRRQWALVGSAAPWLVLGAAAIGLAAWLSWGLSPKPIAPPNAGEAAIAALQSARVQVGHGVRLFDNQDAAGALVWYAEALPGMSQSPDEVHAHRVRVAQAMARVPRLEAMVHVGDNPKHVAFSPDGESIAVAADDGSVEAWSLVGGMRKSRVTRLGSHRLRLEFSTDGRRILAAPFVTDPAIRGASIALGQGFWIDLETGAMNEVARGIAWAVFSPDGRWMASVRPGNEVWLHATDGTRPARLLTRHERSVSALQFSPDNQLVASCSTDHTARVWNVHDGSMACPRLLLPQKGLNLCFSPDSRLLATVAFHEAEASSRIEVWTLATGQPVGSPATVGGAVPFLASSRVGRIRLLHGSLSGGLSVMDMGTGETLASYSLPRGALRCTAISSDGSRVAAGGDDGTACVWDLRTAKPPAAIPVHARAVHWMRFTPDGTRLATASGDGLVRVWNLAPSPEAEPGVVERPGLAIPSGAWAMPGRDFAAMDASGRFLLSSLAQGGHRTPFALDLVTGREEGLPSDGSVIPCRHWMAGHRSETWVSAVFGEPNDPVSRDLCLWRRSAPGWSFSRLSHPAPVWHVRFTQDDRTLVTYALDGGIRDWDASSGRLEREVMLQELQGGRAATLPGGHVSLSDDGRRVACLAHNDRKLRVLDWRDPSRHDLEILLPAPWKGAHWHSGSPILSVEMFGRGTLHWHLNSGQVIPILAMPPTMRMSAWDPTFQRMLALDHFGGSHLVTVDPPSVSTLMDDSAHCQARDLAFSPDGRLLVVIGMDHHVQVRAVPSGQPVTPKLPTGGRPAWAAISRDGVLVVMASPHHVHRWRLSPAKGAPDEILGLAHVLSGRRLNAMGQLEFIEPAVLAELARRLPAWRIAANDRLSP